MMRRCTWKLAAFSMLNTRDNLPTHAVKFYVKAQDHIIITNHKIFINIKNQPCMLSSILTLNQHIIYNEFLPTGLGTKVLETFGLLPLTRGHSRNYQADMDPRIMHEFSTAAFRIGHTELVSVVNRLNPRTWQLQVKYRTLDAIINGI